MLEWKKGVLLPCKLIGFSGKNQTSYYRNIDKRVLLIGRLKKKHRPQLVKLRKEYEISF